MNLRLPRVAWLLAAACLAAAASRIGRMPPTFLYCDQCVMRREVVEWRLAGRWKLFTTTHDAETPISALLQRHQACPPHTHFWSAPRQVAEGELETSEAPRVRSMGLLNVPRSIHFVGNLLDYAGPADVACWRAVLWQPTYASALEPALRFNRFPENGFTTRAEFLAWWSRSAYAVFNRLHEMTEAD